MMVHLHLGLIGHGKENVWSLGSWLLLAMLGRSDA
jgi:hypothetical protein